MQTSKEIKTPALKYFGSKWRIAPWIIKNLPEHRLYCEPFGGSVKTYYLCGWYEPQEQTNKRDERCVCQQHCGNYIRIGCAILRDEKNEARDEDGDT